MRNVSQVQFEPEIAKFFEYSIDMLSIIGMNGYLKKVNHAWEVTLGYSKNELLEVPFIKLVHPDDVNYTIKEMEKTGIIDEPISYRNRIKHKNGSYQTISWNAYTSGSTIYSIGRVIANEKTPDNKYKHYEQLFSLFREAPFIIGIYSGPEFIIEWANPTFQNIFPKRKLLGNKLKEVIPEFEEQGFVELLKNVFTTGGSFIGKEFLTWNNDKSRLEYYTFLYQARKNSEGVTDGVIVFGLDVTEQVLARKTIQEIANKFEFLIESIPHIAWTNDRYGRINYFNNRWFTFTGMTFEDSKDLGWKAAIHPEDIEKLEIIALDSYLKEEGFEMEIRIKRGMDGIYRWHLLKSTPIKNDKGVTSLWIGTSTDIEDLKTSFHKLETMTNELAESEERLKLAMEAMELGTWASDLNTGKRFWTEQTKKILGLPEDVIITETTFWERVFPEDNDYVKEIINAAFNGVNNGLFSMEYRIIRQNNNQLRWVKVVGHVFFNKDKTPVKVIGTIHDITDSKLVINDLQEVNLQLLKTNNDLDNFIYTASHDLKAPVSNIEGLITTLYQTLLEKNVNDEEISEIMNMMNISVQRFQATIKDLTEIAKVQKSNDEDIVNNEIISVVEEIKNSLKSQVSKSNAVIYVNPGYCESIRFSKANFRTILFNLISNSIQYKSFDRDPVIKIRCFETKKYCVLEVKDNGLGIREENLQNIFKMFKRFHTHVEGTGIGLYIVKRIIENAGGKISIQSVLGEGTTVRVCFPYIA